MSRPPKPSLAAIVADAAPKRKGGAPAMARAAKPAASEIVRLAWEGQPDGGDRTVVPAAKAGTLKERAKQMSVYLEPPVYDQLRDLAHTERTKMHALMLEALDLLFRQRGARSIEQVLGESRR